MVSSDCPDQRFFRIDELRLGLLINSVVRSRKRPNALKQGFYTGAPLIPGEDPDEFNKLYAELIDEWKPSAPLYAMPSSNLRT